MSKGERLYACLLGKRRGISHKWYTRWQHDDKEYLKMRSRQSKRKLLSFTKGTRKTQPGFDGPREFPSSLYRQAIKKKKTVRSSARHGQGEAHGWCFEEK